MKLLTFFGMGRYDETEYRWKDSSFKSRFSPLASIEFLKPDQLVVFLTSDVKQSETFSEFKSLVPSNVSIKEVDIPIGKDETELWQIFDAISQQVQRDEETAFDITHGLRHHPFFSLLVASFLRASGLINLKAVLYGAFGILKNENPGCTPVYDLSPMLALLEWSAASDRFNRTGDSRYLADLMKKEEQNLYELSKNDIALLGEKKEFSSLANTLAEISTNLHLLRPEQIMENAANLVSKVQKAKPALARSEATKPLNLLLNSIADSYNNLGLQESFIEQHAKLSLETQLNIIRWYIEREYWVQAVTLIREWLVSWFMYHLEQYDFKQKALREPIEKVINIEGYRLRDAKNRSSFCSLFLKDIPAIEEGLKIWTSLVEVRNDVDHAGMRDTPMSADNIISKIRDFEQHLKTLPLEKYPCT